MNKQRRIILLRAVFATMLALFLIASFVLFSELRTPAATSTTVTPPAPSVRANETMPINTTVPEEQNATVQVNTTMSVDGNESFTPFTLYINAGGEAYTDAKGTQWQADEYYSNSSVYAVDEPILRTDDDVLYQSERWASGGFMYAIPVPNGTYEVTLLFAELYFESSGMREFSVLIENQTIFENIDLFELVGAFTALRESINATVTDGELTITFAPGTIENPKVNALSVTRIE